MFGEILADHDKLFSKRGYYFINYHLECNIKIKSSFKTIILKKSYVCMFHCFDSYINNLQSLHLSLNCVIRSTLFILILLNFEVGKPIIHR